jgi:hypothetical protein
VEGIRTLNRRDAVLVPYRGHDTASAQEDLNTF